MIKSDPKNYRNHSEKNKRIIGKSLKELGAGRSILLDSEDEIIAGNGVYEQAEKQKIPIRVIETDGTELIAVKRTDLKTSDEKRKTLALIDNHSSDTSDFDNELINEDFDKEILDEWEFDIEINLPIEDIKEIDQFNESVNFTIKCDSIEQLEQLQTKLNVSSQKISYKDFIIKVGL